MTTTIQIYYFGRDLFDQFVILVKLFDILDSPLWKHKLGMFVSNTFVGCKPQYVDM